MPTVRLLSQRLRNFRTWRELDYVFEEVGVVMVRGLDLVTRTSSGAGKSGFLSAPAYVLGCGDPTTATRSWGTDASSVELVISIDGAPVSVERGTDGLRVSLEDRTLRGREAEEKLRELVGPTDILRPMTWREQQTQGHFLSLQPAKRQALLVKLLALAPFEQEAERARRAATTATSTAEAARSELERATRRKADLRPVPPLEIDLAPLVEQEAEVARYVGELERGDQDRASALLRSTQEIGQWERCREAARHEYSDAVRNTQLGSGRCPTCLSLVTPNAELVSAQQLRVEQMDAVIAAADMEIPKLRARADELRAAAPPLVELRQAWAEARSQLAHARDVASKHDVAVARHEALMQELGQQVARAQAQAAEQAAIAERERDLHRFLREWQTGYGAELLADLSAATNAILERVPNVAEVSVEFVPEERSDGRIEPVHRILVAGEVRADGLSGGQRSSVELAVDLALAEVCWGRSQYRPTWMILDEPFSGMGFPDREAFVELLQERAVDRGQLFLVVDQHTREFGELFCARGVGIVRDHDRTSRLVSADERASW